MEKNVLKKSAHAQKRYVRAKEAAEYLKIAKSTLWHWSKTRTDFPKPIRAGERVTLFDLDAIEAFLASATKEV